MQMVYLGIIGQTIAAIVLIVAVTLLVHQRADPGNILVSIGAVLFAVFTKIRLIGYEWDDFLSSNRKKRRR